MKTTKANELVKWQNLEANQNPLKYMEAIPYKAEGSKYGACGIRIDGNPQFINAVLSCLKPLIAGENHQTRLELARHEVQTKVFNKTFENTAENAEVCYIRLHRRGKGMPLVLTMAEMQQRDKASDVFEQLERQIV